ncbi:response regulator transcription factor [Laceyella sacchari]|jgi:two-component system, OmpR family, response regulator ArlR|uniref:Response regulator transcription factor n=1 Tax=Laceyella sacchari TaxID=37482 RepID=A0ABY5U306_LACSH|nr:response regulator transcription factor [Laceyella sacchari]UWE04012.1 response regulator transcription factor [Laceyella sacchari]
MSRNVLLVEDEGNIARFLQLELEYEGYRVMVAPTGRKALELWETDQWDMLILDVMLPDLSGMEICRRIRGQSQVPIIILTARDAVPDRVSGLDAGADDYLTKPFAIEELLARMRAIERRQSQWSQPLTKLTLDPLVVLLEERTVTVAGKELKLTTREFDLLAYLMQNKNHVLTREMILDKVWGYSYTGDTNVVDVYIRYLRVKLEQMGCQNIIETVRGVGYVIREH